jgi:hypothetical protein
VVDVLQGLVLPMMIGLVGMIGTGTEAIQPPGHCACICPCGFPLPQTIVMVFAVDAIIVPPTTGSHVTLGHPTTLYLTVSPGQTVLMHSICSVPGVMVTVLVMVSAQHVFITGVSGGFPPPTVIKL